MLDTTPLSPSLLACCFAPSPPPACARGHTPHSCPPHTRAPPLLRARQPHTRAGGAKPKTTTTMASPRRTLSGGVDVDAPLLSHNERHGERDSGCVCVGRCGRRGGGRGGGRCVWLGVSTCRHAAVVGAPRAPHAVTRPHTHPSTLTHSQAPRPPNPRPRPPRRRPRTPRPARARRAPRPPPPPPPPPPRPPC